MLPSVSLGIAVIGIVLSGILIAIAVGGYWMAYPVLFAWLWFNIFIAIYEFYIVARWRSMKGCPVDFWKTKGTFGGFWLDAWKEYACQADRRYLQTSMNGRPNFVYWIEFGNAVLVVLLWVAFLMRAWSVVGMLLILQAYHCILYFLSWFHSGVPVVSWKGWLYLGISALWVVVPLVAYGELVRLKGIK